MQYDYDSCQWAAFQLLKSQSKQKIKDWKIRIPLQGKANSMVLFSWFTEQKERGINSEEWKNSQNGSIKFGESKASTSDGERFLRKVS
jgi:hypothetical protein